MTVNTFSFFTLDNFAPVGGSPPITGGSSSFPSGSLPSTYEVGSGSAIPISVTDDGTNTPSTGSPTAFENGSSLPQYLTSDVTIGTTTYVGDGTSNGTQVQNEFLLATDPSGTNIEIYFVRFSAPGGGSPFTTVGYTSNVPIPANTQLTFTSTGKPNPGSALTPEYGGLLCFREGTPIATPAAERPVEALGPGDPVLTADGRVVPVKWIGRQTRMVTFSGDAVCPVRIRAGALADNVPHADLDVTADHGMLVDGLVVNAGALVNGTSVVRVPASELPARIT